MLPMSNSTLLTAVPSPGARSLPSGMAEPARESTAKQDFREVLADVALTAGRGDAMAQGAGDQEDVAHRESPEGESDSGEVIEADAGEGNDADGPVDGDVDVSEEPERAEFAALSGPKAGVGSETDGELVQGRGAPALAGKRIAGNNETIGLFRT